MARAFFQCSIGVEIRESLWGDLIGVFLTLIRLPYLYLEAVQMKNRCDKGESLGTSPLLQGQVLSLTGNLLYFTLWLYGKGWMKLAPKSVLRLRGIYYISQIILYERSVTIVARALYQYQSLRRNHPALYSEKEEVALLKEQSVTLLQALMQGLSHYFGVPYPRRYHTLLPATRISLGLFAIRSERDGEFSKICHYFMKGGRF